MPYKKVLAADVPKRSRKSTSRFEKTPEWRAMKADLIKGLKPREVLQISLTDEDKERCGISNRRTIVRFLQKYLTDHKLPYALQSFRRNDLDYFVVRHPKKDAGTPKE